MKQFYGGIMKKSRILALLLALVLVLAACSSNNEETKVETAAEGESSAEAETVSEEVITEVTEPTTIVFWHAMNGEQEESLTKMTEAFMEANENITVELQNQTGYQELQQKLTATTTSPKIGRAHV